MKLHSTGFYASILILISLMLTCHISNFLYPKTKFANLELSIPNRQPPIDYNRIYYQNNSMNNYMDDNMNNNINNECNQQNGKQNIIQNNAEVPCKAIQSCSDTQPTPIQYQLSDSELAVIYKAVYQEAGLEIFKRTLNPQPTTK